MSVTVCALTWGLSRASSPWRSLYTHGDLSPSGNNRAVVTVEKSVDGWKRAGPGVVPVRTSIFPSTFTRQAPCILPPPRLLERGVKSKPCNCSTPAVHLLCFIHLVSFWLGSCLHAPQLSLSTELREVVNLTTEFGGTNIQNAILVLLTLSCFTKVSSRYEELQGIF